MQMTQKQLEKLERVLQKGRSHFIWYRGVLGWGVFVAIFWCCWMSYFQGWKFFTTLPLALILFPIGGYFWGASMWRKCETLREEANKNKAHVD